MYRIVINKTKQGPYPLTHKTMVSISYPDIISTVVKSNSVILRYVWYIMHGSVIASND